MRSILRRSRREQDQRPADLLLEPTPHIALGEEELNASEGDVDVVGVDGEVAVSELAGPGGVSRVHRAAHEVDVAHERVGAAAGGPAGLSMASVTTTWAGRWSLQSS